MKGGIWRHGQLGDSLRIGLAAAVLTLLAIMMVTIVTNRRRPILWMHMFTLSLMQFAGMFILSTDSLVIDVSSTNIYECIVHIGFIHVGLVLLFWPMFIHSLRQWYTYGWAPRHDNERDSTPPTLYRFFENRGGVFNIKSTYAMLTIIPLLHLGLAIWDMTRRADAAIVGRFECTFQHSVHHNVVMVMYIILTVTSACLDIIMFLKRTHTLYCGVIGGVCGRVAWALYFVFYIASLLGRNTTIGTVTSAWAPYYVWLLFGICTFLIMRESSSFPLCTYPEEPSSFEIIESIQANSDSDTDTDTIPVIEEATDIGEK